MSCYTINNNDYSKDGIGRLRELVGLTGDFEYDQEALEAVQLARYANMNVEASQAEAAAANSKGGMAMLDAHIHCCTKFPWLILVLSILGSHTGIYVNAYQAEGGFSPQTFGIAFVCEMLSMIGMMFWWFFLLPLCLPLIVYVFSIFRGYKVMQKSK